MRFFCVALLGMGCTSGAVASDGAVAIDGAVVDAPVPDAYVLPCPSGGYPDGGEMACAPPTGTASVAATVPSGSLTFNYLFAGATLSSPVAPDIEHPLSIELYFTTAPSVGHSLFACTYTPTPDCCNFGAVAVAHKSLSPGSELGAHNVTIEIIDDQGSRYLGNGVLTLTQVDQPDSPNARVAGSISLDDGTATMSGTFDSEFCEELLLYPI